jgi:bifunctional DNase/RNase
MRQAIAALLLAAVAAFAVVYFGRTLLRSAEDARVPRAGQASERAAPPAPEALADAVSMRVRGVGMDPETGAPMVVLTDDEEARALPIFIGPSEAMAIARRLGEVDSPRPMTHDLILDILGGLDARVLRVHINDVREGTFYAILTIDRRGEVVSVDSRPSDAIAVALRAGIPILVARAVLEQAPPLDLDALELYSGEEEGGSYVGPLGLAVQELTPDLAAALEHEGRSSGALVAHVDAAGPAAAAGLEVGDLILGLDGSEVGDAATFARAAREATSDPLVLTILRGGRERTIRIRPAR